MGPSQVALVVKNLPANAGDIRDVGVILGSGRSPGERNGHPLQNSCLKKYHGLRNLADYSPQGHKESNMTEATYHATRGWADGQERVDSTGIWLRQNRRRLSLKKEGMRT